MPQKPEIRYHVTYSIDGREQVAIVEEETLVNAMRDLFALYGPIGTDTARLDYVNIIPLQSNN